MNPWVFQRFPWLAVVLNYKLGFFLIFLSLTVLLTLVPVLESVGSFSDYQFDVETGLIPDLKISFSSYVDDAGLAEIQKELLALNGVDRLYAGYQGTFENVIFDARDGMSLPKDVEIFAVIFNGDFSVDIQQGENVVPCDVVDVQEFGGWSLGVDDHGMLIEGTARLWDGSRALPIDIYESNGKKWISFSGDRDGGGAEPFQQFLYGFISRFASLDKSGIGFDRFSSYEDGVSNGFDRFKKRSLCAFADLIFTSGDDDVPILVSESILNDVSTYGIGGNARLSLGNIDFDLRIIDGFKYFPDKILNQNFLFINAKNIDREFLTSSFNSVIHLYFENNVANESLFEKISRKYPQAKIVKKEDVIPVQYQQKMYLQIGKYVLISFIIIIIPIILFIKLLNFYNKNNNALTLLNVYGLKIRLFTRALFIIVVFSIIVSLFVILIVFYKNNIYLNYYMYPSINYSKEVLLWIYLFVFSVLIMVGLLEGKLLSSLSYEKRGQV